MYPQEGPVEIEYGENFVDGECPDLIKLLDLSVCVSLTTAAGYPAGGRLESVSEEEGGEETATYRLSCPWNYTAAGRLLSVVGVGLILIAIIACCCSGLLSLEMEGTQEEEEEGIKKREVKNFILSIWPQVSLLQRIFTISPILSFDQKIVYVHSVISVEGGGSE